MLLYIDVALHVPVRSPQVDRFLYSMRLNDDQLRDVSARLLREMQNVLSSKSSAAESIKMLPTHVCSTPDGSGDMREGTALV